jgi:D-alanyl-D-alanine carboxypeptidase (penicillin-binding protein 5/6)
MIKIKIFILFLFFTLSAYSWGSPNINVKSAILLDYNSDKVLYKLNPDFSISPASMSKIMTTIVAFDLLKQGKISLDDQFIVSEKAWRMSQSGFSSMFIMLNDSVTIEELLKGIIIVSGNDACVTLAEGIAGTEKNFVEMMNEKAEEIGLSNTSFANSSGLEDSRNFSTVRDIATMSKYLIVNYPKYYEYFKETEFTWDRTGGDPIKQGNRNPLLYKNIGADGIKTGYLASEKYSLAASVIGEKRRVISVISGSQTKKARSLDSIKLISWGLRNTTTYEIAEKNIPNFKFKTWLGKKDFVDGIVKEDMYVTISKKEIKGLKVTINYNGPIMAPIEKDQEIGTLIVKIGDEEIRSLPIYSNEKIKKVNFFKSLFFSLNYMIWGDA